MNYTLSNIPNAVMNTASLPRTNFCSGLTQVVEQQLTDLITSLTSSFFDDAKMITPLFGCTASLITGSALTSFTKSPVPFFLGLFNCLQPTLAKKNSFTSLEKVITAVDEITSTISDLSTVYSKVSIAQKIGDGGGYPIDTDDYFQHALNAIINTADEIQTFASPITSIVTSITDALADEALSRFTTLSDLMQLHNEINRIREAIKESENALKEIHQSNLAEVNALKNGLDLDYIRTQLNECLRLERNTRQQIKELENAIVDSEAKLASSSQRFFKLNNSLKTIYESLDKNPEHYDEFASKIAQIEEQRDKAESNVYLHQDAIDDFKSRITESQQNLAEGLLVIQEWQTMLEQRNNFLAQFNSIQTEITSAHQNLLKTEIKKLRELAEAKYAHFRIMLNDANARLNSRKNEL